MKNPTIETGSNAPSMQPKAEMDAILVELPSCGLGTAALARKHGIAPWKLYNVQEQRRGGRKKRPKRTGLITVKISTPDVSKAESFELSSTDLTLLLDGIDLRGSRRRLSRDATMK